MYYLVLSPCNVSMHLMTPYESGRNGQIWMFTRECGAMSNGLEISPTITRWCKLMDAVFCIKIYAGAALHTIVVGFNSHSTIPYGRHPSTLVKLGRDPTQITYTCMQWSYSHAWLISFQLILIIPSYPITFQQLLDPSIGDGCIL